MTMVDFLHGSLAKHHLIELLDSDLTNIRYASVFEALMTLEKYHDTAFEFQEVIEKLLNMYLEDLGDHPKTREVLNEGFATCVEIGFALGQMTELVRYQKYATKGLIAEENEDRTILAANARRSADAAGKWLPHQQEFQRLVSGGMKPDRARADILGDWTEGDSPPSMKTARKWLRSDGEAD